MINFNINFLSMEGSEHLYLGKYYKLHLEKSSSSNVWIEDDKLCISSPTRLNRKNINTLLDHFYKLKSHEIFRERLEIQYKRFSEIYPNHPKPKIRLRKMKSRWGSMSYKHNMSLNIILLKARIEVIDYIIMHELAHMEEMNHSKDFYKIQNHFVPNWKELREELRYIPL